MSLLSSPSRRLCVTLVVALPALLTACGEPAEEAATPSEAGVAVARSLRRGVLGAGFG